MAVSTSKYRYVDCDPDLCIGCQICEYVCSYTKTGEYNTYRSRIRTVRVDEVLITAIACRTCENAPCVIACPQNALAQDPDTGIIHIDNQNATLAVHRSLRFRRDLHQSISSWRRNCNARTWKKDPNVCFGARRKRSRSPHLNCAPRNHGVNWSRKKL